MFDMRMPNNSTRYPPIRPRRMRTSRANTVPPGPAIGPSMVHDERNIATVVTHRVRAEITKVPFARICYSGMNSRKQLILGTYSTIIGLNPLILTYFRKSNE